MWGANVHNAVMASDSGTTLCDHTKIKFTIDKGCKLACPLPSIVFKVRVCDYNIIILYSDHVLGMSTSKRLKKGT